jgi:hypothetical protein
MAEKVVGVMIGLQVIACISYMIEGDPGRSMYWSGAVLLTVATLVMR